jgi:hypothetical protein
VLQGKFELTLLGLDQMLARTKVTTPEVPQNPQLASRAPAKPKHEEKPPETSAAMPPPPADENENKTADGLLINGSDNDAATSKYSLSPAFRNHRPGMRGLYTGGFASAISIRRSMRGHIRSPDSRCRRHPTVGSLPDSLWVGR